MNSAADERREVEYAVHGGVSLKAHLYAPKGPGKFPALVAVHGGGWRLANLDNYRYLGPWLAERGYVTLAVTHRLSKPAEKVYPEAVQDVRAAVQFVKGRAAELRIDPERIALMGDSSGGHLASLVALAGEHALFKDGNPGDPHGSISTQVKAAVSVYGVHDLARQWRHDQVSRPRDQIVERFLGASLLDDRRIYFDASPLSYVSAKNNGTAFLLAWGTGDDVVDHEEQGEAFLEALKQAGHYVRSAVLAGAPHFWIGDPIDEPGSYSGFFAPRLLRFLQGRL
ncbi:MAG TPA: alpha/beta hydrolase [Burkholderiales bacterium]|jgi:acetyl esterase/lipase|nr:alpha/beta hydrolase [Burkholderiales bacterium]